MEEIVTILSTREWAIAIWGTGFFVWMLTQREIRKSLWNVIKILLGKNLRHFFLIITENGFWIGASYQGLLLFIKILSMESLGVCRSIYPRSIIVRWTSTAWKM